jgi:hypothetical protein
LSFEDTTRPLRIHILSLCVDTSTRPYGYTLSLHTPYIRLPRRVPYGLDYRIEHVTPVPRGHTIRPSLADTHSIPLCGHIRTSLTDTTALRLLCGHIHLLSLFYLLFPYLQFQIHKGFCTEGGILRIKIQVKAFGYNIRPSVA